MPETAILKCLYQKNNRKDTDMGRDKDSKDSRKGKHLQWEDRLKIEAYSESRLAAKEIALAVVKNIVSKNDRVATPLRNVP